MKAPIRFLTVLLGSLFFIAAGGRAHASAFGPPAGDKVKIDVSSASIGTNSTATLTVTVTRPSGLQETDGTVLSASVSSPTIGTVAGIAGSGTSTGNTSRLVGGKASFVFVANNTPGTATITVTLPPVNGHPTSVTATTTITVTQGGSGNSSLQLSASSTSLPQNPYDIGQQQDGSLGFPTNYLGSPFIAEVTVQWRGLITGAPQNGKVNVAISPTTVASYSTLDDPTTQWTGQTKTPPTIDGNEFLTLMGSGTVNVTAGIGTIFVHASSIPGTATLTVSATDPDTNLTVSSQIAITVVSASNGMPAILSLSQSAGGVYVNGGNGPQSKMLTAQATDSSGAQIANPASGVNNVQFQIVGPTGTDAMLYAVDASGRLRGDKTVKAMTYNGVANISFLAGKVQGPVQIQATADSSDNNVDNGIANPVSATTTVIVSDGQLYSVTITSPMINAIAVNGITSSTSSTGGGSTTPALPDATYSLTVSALATDRQGNPVLPGTPIRFGLIDTPQALDYSSACGIGAFQICGQHGYPQPGTMSFSAPDGLFHSAGGGAGPGDTLVVFGKQLHGAPAGNDDLESAQAISGIVDDTRLFTIFPFNWNDTTGYSVSSGPVLPYVIGRATIGNINSPAATDSNGRTTITGTATTTMNYPVSQLNRSVVIWAQGVGPDTATGGTRTVTDAVVTIYPAVADLVVSASPNPINGNITLPVTVCVVDAQHVPISGVRFNFGFSNLGVGSGKVDGIATSGWTSELTDSSGCLVAQVTTQGIANSSGSGGSGGTGSSGTPTLTFIAPGYGAGSTGAVAIPIIAGGDLILNVSPSALGGTGGNVSLTLLDSSGNPVSGVALKGSCTGNTVSLSSSPGVTGADGKTSATISADLNAYGTINTGTCTFTTATGSPTATVTLSGQNLCINEPTHAGCTSGTGGSGAGNTVNITVDASASPAVPSNCASNCTAAVTATIGGGTGVFSPSGSKTVTCYATPAQPAATCQLTVPQGVSSITLQATPATGGEFGSWSNTCTGTTPTTTLPIAGTTNCTATFVGGGL